MASLGTARLARPRNRGLEKIVNARFKNRAQSAYRPAQKAAVGQHEQVGTKANLQAKLVGAQRNAALKRKGVNRGPNQWLGLNNLSARGNSGAISGERVGQVATQRAQLANKYGANWHKAVYGSSWKPGQLKRLRQTISAGNQMSQIPGAVNPNQAGYEAAKKRYAALMAKRKEALANL